MPTQQSVTTWVRRLEDGDELAAQKLWDRYFAKLVGLARVRLRGVRGPGDEEDVALSAFHSFCQALMRRRFQDLQDREDLWQILVMHVSRKAVDARRYSARAKRGGDVTRDADTELDEVLGTEPDPQFAALVSDQFQWLLDLLEDDDLKLVAVHKLEGCTNPEIAQRMQISLRSVERKVSVIRSLWDEALHEEAAR